MRRVQLRADAKAADEAAIKILEGRFRRRTPRHLAMEATHLAPEPGVEPVSGQPLAFRAVWRLLAAAEAIRIASPTAS